ncbi:hypothetical protein [Cardinium endosymbiont of Nabis limbatus]|uniref:hypothetical protein n=1 Tax=Cardinium endosymbiont of Nabis limbatus TaxID=3066217 RepID=UPI003AF3F3A4
MRDKRSMGIIPFVAILLIYGHVCTISKKNIRGRKYNGYDRISDKYELGESCEENTKKLLDLKKKNSNESISEKISLKSLMNSIKYHDHNHDQNGYCYRVILNLLSDKDSKWINQQVQYGGVTPGFDYDENRMHILDPDWHVYKSLLAVALETQHADAYMPLLAKQYVQKTHVASFRYVGINTKYTSHAFGLLGWVFYNWKCNQAQKWNLSDDKLANMISDIITIDRDEIIKKSITEHDKALGTAPIYYVVLFHLSKLLEKFLENVSNVEELLKLYTHNSKHFSLLHTIVDYRHDGYHRHNSDPLFNEGTFLKSNTYLEMFKNVFKRIYDLSNQSKAVESLFKQDSKQYSVFARSYMPTDRRDIRLINFKLFRTGGDMEYIWHRALHRFKAILAEVSLFLTSEHWGRIKAEIDALYNKGRLSEDYAKRLKDACDESASKTSF